MEPYEFETFLAENHLDLSNDFSIPLQKQVHIFNELREKRDDTIGEDRQEVDRTLNERAEKILLEMEAELEDRLANNEVVEVEEPKKEKKPKKPKEAPAALSAPPLSTEEQQLQQLFDHGLRKISRSEWKRKGFQTPLNGQTVRIGSFELAKYHFSYTYAIRKVRAVGHERRKSIPLTEEK